jgi:hypothetical protein
MDENGRGGGPERKKRVELYRPHHTERKERVFTWIQRNRENEERKKKKRKKKELTIYM